MTEEEIQKIIAENKSLKQHIALLSQQLAVYASQYRRQWQQDQDFLPYEDYDDRQ